MIVSQVGHYAARSNATFKGEFMAIRHVVTIQVAPGRTAEFADSFRALQAIARQEDGCEQYELFQSLDDPDRVVLLERWASQELLEQHMQAERSRNHSAVDALMALWAPGVTPTVERFEA
jgi:quinol monooxygenase YgiN